jgi:hypothetical protein
MNLASTNLPHHLNILRERATKGSDYEKAMHYFLEEFAGDEKFILDGQADDAHPLQELVTHAVSQARNKKVEVKATRIFSIPDHQFHHGSLVLPENEMILFFYFSDCQTGILSLITDMSLMQVMRFQNANNLPNVKGN